jgi:hypothetical protein
MIRQERLDAAIGHPATCTAQRHPAACGQDRSYLAPRKSEYAIGKSRAPKRRKCADQSFL